MLNQNFKFLNSYFLGDVKIIINHSLGSFHKHLRPYDFLASCMEAANTRNQFSIKYESLMTYRTQHLLQVLGQD